MGRTWLPILGPPRMFTGIQTHAVGLLAKLPRATTFDFAPITMFVTSDRSRRKETAYDGWMDGVEFNAPLDTV